MTSAEPDTGPAPDRGAATVRAAMDALAAGGRSILGRSLEGREIESFTRYLGLLQTWQRVHRLVGSVEAAWVVDNLFLDSLLFLRVLPSKTRSVADLGSGAGFPGIPIKIVRPDVEMVLIESRQRRVSFLSTVVRELGLGGVRVLNGRAEGLGEDIGQRLDAVLMRCAGPAKTLMAVAESLVVPGGVVISSAAPLGRSSARGESVEVQGAFEGRTRNFLVYKVPGSPGPV